MRNAKLAILPMFIVFGLLMTGIGYAHWSEVLTISGTVETGNINFGMHLAPNSIGASYYGNPTSPLPVNTGTDDGNWDSPSQNDIDWQRGLMGPIVNDWLHDPYPGPPSWMAEDPATETGSLLDKDVGSTGVTMSDDAGSYTSNLDGNPYTLSKTMTITVNNAYPDYITGVSFCVANSGSVPIELIGLKAIGVPPELEVVMLDYPVLPLPGGQGTVSGYDWGICFLTDSNEFPIPEGHRFQLDQNESWLTGIGIRCLQSADEGATYSFTIELMAQQWNAD